jgi:hypothetical protein
MSPRGRIIQEGRGARVPVLLGESRDYRANGWRFVRLALLPLRLLCQISSWPMPAIAPAPALAGTACKCRSAAARTRLGGCCSSARETAPIQEARPCRTSHQEQWQSEPRHNRGRRWRSNRLACARVGDPIGRSSLHTLYMGACGRFHGTPVGPRGSHFARQFCLGQVVIG